MKSKTEKKTTGDVNKSRDVSKSFYWFILLSGVLVRSVFIFFRFHETLQRRVEIVSPVTSWYRAKECMMLSKLGISPYSGDICHQPPLLILLFDWLPRQHSYVFFVLVDVLAAAILHNFATIFTHAQLKLQDQEKQFYAKGTIQLLIKDNRHIPNVVMATYLVCPYSIANCLAHSTVVLNNLVVAVMLLAMSNDYLAIASICVAMVTYLSLYPIMLLVPVCLCVWKVYDKSTRFWKILQCVSSFIISLCILLQTSATVSGSWDFVSAVYGFVLEANDLTPNIGLFWYFFLEMFDHFRLFFLCVYQINVFIYAIPLAVVFREYPYLVFYSLLSLTCLLKSYSNFGDLAAPLAMLPLWSFVYRYMRNFLLIACMFFFTTILAPLMWQMWIYAGAGNANFFYAVTLIYSTAQVFLISDVLYAFLRRKYHLKTGICSNQQSQVVMK